MSKNESMKKVETAILDLSELNFQADFAELGGIRAYAPGAELLQQGIAANEIFLIHEGVVKLVWTEPRGKQTILGLRWPGYPLGVPSGITGEVSPMSAVTVVRCLIQRISAKDFVDQLRTNSDLAWKMHQIHSSELCEQLTLIGELACCSARARLARVFKRLIAGGRAHSDGKRTQLRLPLKQKEVAELIGVTPEHLSRMLHVLSRDGLLHVYKGWIVIPNPQALLSL